MTYNTYFMSVSCRAENLKIEVIDMKRTTNFPPGFPNPKRGQRGGLLLGLLWGYFLVSDCFDVAGFVWFGS